MGGASAMGKGAGFPVVWHAEKLVASKKQVICRVNIIEKTFYMKEIKVLVNRLSALRAIHC
jgi:hypothetical protein